MYTKQIMGIPYDVKKKRYTKWSYCMATKRGHHGFAGRGSAVHLKDGASRDFSGNFLCAGRPIGPRRVLIWNALQINSIQNT